ncbi:hypothetical protein B0H13DRAFT_1924011 [Mycena leptocephala]|nr:hypothetical protein B0H13DRAFT_1924011 [Mycena leptocephala]
MLHSVTSQSVRHRPWPNLWHQLWELWDAVIGWLAVVREIWLQMRFFYYSLCALGQDCSTCLDEIAITTPGSQIWNASGFRPQSESQVDFNSLLSLNHQRGTILHSRNSEEIKYIKQHAMRKVPVLWLDKDMATIGDVQKGMKESRWVHFACHGVQSTSPTESALLLAGSSRLTLSNIIQLSLPNADLAFLSACQTPLVPNSSKMSRFISLLSRLDFLQWSVRGSSYSVYETPTSLMYIASNSMFVYRIQPEKFGDWKNRHTLNVPEHKQDSQPKRLN